MSGEPQRSSRSCTIRRDENAVEPGFGRPDVKTFASHQGPSKPGLGPASNTAKQATQATHESRRILSEISNSGHETRMAPSKISTFSEKLKQAMGTKENVSYDKHLKQPIQKKEKESESHKSAQKNENEEILQHFFDDNETRFADEKEPELKPVPVLPIIVPDEIKRLIIKSQRKTGEKRHGYYVDDGLSDAQKRTRPTGDKGYRNASQRIFSNSNKTEPIRVDESTRKETEQYEKDQEERSKKAMLQTDQNTAIENWDDPMLVAEYADEIFKYLKESETTTMADPFYASHQQHEISWTARGVLVDWVIEIHYLFQLMPETLFLAVNMIDRFLSKRTVALGKLQLVGIAALFIATKFEESATPPIREFLFMTDKSIEEEDLLKAERFILQVLDFQLCYSNPLNFLRRATMATTYDLYTRALAKYFMEISIVDHRFITIRPSLVAAASLWLAQKMLAQGVWTEELARYSGYTVQDFKPIVELMLDYLAQPVRHDAFFRKWASRRMMKASIFVRDWVQTYYVR
ncbi:G2/mitotic-specific cyclin [Apophysomyces ossiformis]|uniref:G2/mitotic-specific cyclin n=1 Tax=Apophysomyces ossiformis TaxID=679940 RepID=A0A8H7BKJ2_9FUNG|nr:G2/mitotic-specific cyclin [Apophysomyces ossiformis]